jgi:cell division protein FtsZ
LRSIWKQTEFVASKPAAKIVEEVIPAEMDITMKQVDGSLQMQLQNSKKSPMEMTIDETLRLRADERRKTERIQL